MPDIRQARETLEKYRKGRMSLERRVIENERWYRLRHWEFMERSKNSGDPEPTSAWLFNSIANKHADAMDSYPEPVVLPREESDRQTAQTLSAVIPVIQERQAFREEYSRHWWRKLRHGTGIYGVLWDSDVDNGIGDVSVKDVDVLTLYWEPGVSDIQRSRNVFHLTSVDRDVVRGMYPDKVGDRLTGSGGTDVAQYVQDDSREDSEKCTVVDWYYKVRQGTRTVLHYCKFVEDIVLYSTEDEGMADGLYAHGKYPFVFDVLFPVEGSPAGFGWLDVCKDPQVYIDKLGGAILKNAVWSAKPRHFVSESSTVNAEEYANLDKDFVRVAGAGLDIKSGIMPIEVRPLPAICQNVLDSKINELKETSGNRDFSQGGTTAGVTAASAIAVLQEAGNKLARDMISASYSAYEKVCYLIIELIRQFYSEARTFRITGQDGMEQFVRLSNAGIVPHDMGNEMGRNAGTKLPIFDLKVRAQKRSAFSTLAQNEMAKEFFAAGFFNPQLAEQALACIEMMDFEGKAQVEQRIQQNSLMMQQMQMMQQQIAMLTDIVNQTTGDALGSVDGGEALPSGGAQPPAAAREMSRGSAGNPTEELARQTRAKAQRMVGGAAV